MFCLVNGITSTRIAGELKQWHTVTLTFDGPETSEQDPINPFLDYRLDVTFSNGNEEIVIPGFYAADGNAGETSADKGNKWAVRFAPNKTGKWTYKTSFVKGKNIAVADDASKGEKVSSFSMENQAHLMSRTLIKQERTLERREG